MKAANVVRDAAGCDFETMPITNRPKYPPEPVGVSIAIPGTSGGKSKYLAWGHVQGGNTCSYGEARQALGDLIESGRPMVFHNAKFDLSVMLEKMGLPQPKPLQVHDTMVLAFLDDPRRHTLELKPLTEKLFGLPPDEKDAIVDWLLKHQPIPGERLVAGKKSKTGRYAGAFIAYAPTDIVAPYANSDVSRTLQVFKKMYPDILKRQMGPAYDRERLLLPTIMEMERDGVRVDLKRLQRDVEMYNKALAKLDDWLKTRLKSKDLNLDADEDVVEAMIKAKVCDITQLGVTKGGKPQANKEALERGITDKQVLAALVYRTQLCTCLRTFMESWLATATKSGGFIYTTWHTTRTAGAQSYGARTGRFSSTPPFQNIPNEFKPTFQHLTDDLKLRKTLPKAPFELPPLPYVRSYIIPYDDDHCLLVRDYSQQEPRIAAHFEEGELRQAYIDDPWLDVHNYAKDFIVRATGREWERRPVKDTNLGSLYGMGVEKLAFKTRLSYDEAKQLKADIMAGPFKGIKDMYDDMREVRKAGTSIRTWGGREYYCEESKIFEGRMKHFDYKLVNVLIQGSAADCTKEAMIRYAAEKPKDTKLLLQVHDELVISAPKKYAKQRMEQLRVHMEGVEFDVQMLTEGEISYKNWGDGLVDYDKKGKIVYHA